MNGLDRKLMISCMMQVYIGGANLGPVARTLENLVKDCICTSAESHGHCCVQQTGEQFCKLICSAAHIPNFDLIGSKCCIEEDLSRLRETRYSQKNMDGCAESRAKKDRSHAFSKSARNIGV